MKYGGWGGGSYKTLFSPNSNSKGFSVTSVLRSTECKIKRVLHNVNLWELLYVYRNGSNVNWRLSCLRNRFMNLGLRHAEHKRAIGPLVHIQKISKYHTDAVPMLATGWDRGSALCQHWTTLFFVYRLSSRHDRMVTLQIGIYCVPGACFDVNLCDFLNTW